MVWAAASSLPAWRSKSARVPLRALEALLGNLTPSIANISRDEPLPVTYEQNLTEDASDVLT